MKQDEKTLVSSLFSNPNDRRSATAPASLALQKFYIDRNISERNDPHSDGTNLVMPDG
ncbi:MAG: hypothetical protein AB2L24_32815 [Mangrovibacterium sp.]